MAAGVRSGRPWPVVQPPAWVGVPASVVGGYSSVDLEESCRLCAQKPAAGGALWWNLVPLLVSEWGHRPADYGLLEQVGFCPTSAILWFSEIE